jgi:hypothetical protein
MICRLVLKKLLHYSAIFVAGKNRSSVEKELTYELHSVSQWLIDNKFSLHLGKKSSTHPSIHPSINPSVRTNQSYIMGFGLLFS